MAFKKGQSGNPAGRPLGALNKRTLAAQALNDASEDVAKAMIEAAKGGDVQAGRLILDRVQPPLRPRADTVKFTLDPEAPLTAQAQQIVVSCAAGELDPETAQMLVGILSAFAGLKQTDELSARIAQLEASAKDAQQATAPGGVLQGGSAA